MEKYDKLDDKEWKYLYHAPIYPRLIEHIDIGECRQIDKEDDTKCYPSSREIESVIFFEKDFFRSYCEEKKQSTNDKEKTKEPIRPTMKECLVERGKYLGMKCQGCLCDRCISISKTETIEELEEDKRKIYHDDKKYDPRKRSPLRKETLLKGENKCQSCDHSSRIDDESLTFRISEKSDQESKRKDMDFFS